MHRRFKNNEKGEESLPCLEIAMEMNERKGMATAQ
jgi:hypothetical protein